MSTGATAVPQRPALVAVAHGSRDPRSAATVRSLVGLVRSRAPRVEVRTAFLDLSEPSVANVLTELHARGQRQVVLVPLLLGKAYHARVDLPSIVDEVTANHPGLRVAVADVLGSDATVRALALRRVRETGAEPADPELGLVLAAVGSSHRSANAAVERIALDWRATYGCHTAAAFASAARPDVAGALAVLRARGAQRFAVASWFLAPGLLPDRLRESALTAVPDARLAAPLGADDRLAEVVLRRYRAAVATTSHTAPGSHSVRLSTTT